MPPNRIPRETPPEWFARPDAPEGGAGLRFGCTMCGNCCSGPSGYVIVDDAECAALAARLGLPLDAFLADFTTILPEGRSLIERQTPAGLDCIFLDRDKIPGKAVCGVYEDRPKQCRTWPFWPSIIRSRRAWDQAKRVCPGIDQGRLVTVEQIRIQRDTVEI